MYGNDPAKTLSGSCQHISTAFQDHLMDIIRSFLFFNALRSVVSLVSEEDLTDWIYWHYEFWDENVVLCINI